MLASTAERLSLRTGARAAERSGSVGRGVAGVASEVRLGGEDEDLRGEGEGDGGCEVDGCVPETERQPVLVAWPEAPPP
jgi:hypothetical protein